MREKVDISLYKTFATHLLDEYRCTPRTRQRVDVTRGVQLESFDHLFPRFEWSLPDHDEVDGQHRRR